MLLLWFARSLEGRLATLGAVRSTAQLEPGILDAPVGTVTIAFLHVVGAQVCGACSLSLQGDWSHTVPGASCWETPQSSLLLLLIPHLCRTQTLLSWNADLAQQALKTFHGVVGEELKHRNVGAWGRGWARGPPECGRKPQAPLHHAPVIHNPPCPHSLLSLSHSTSPAAAQGYLVEAVDGLFLSAFQHPMDAILWALDCNEKMIRQVGPGLGLGNDRGVL